MLIDPRAVLGVALLVATLSSAPPRVQADIYYRMERGVPHFTNIPRSDRGWRRIMRTGPGKARSVHAVRRKSADPERYQRFEAHILQAAALYHIPVALVRAVIHVESDYDPEAVSRAGARGLMQLMPKTAQSMGVESVHDPRQNIFGGVRFLRVLANRFKGDMVRTIAAYHAGPHAVRRYDGIPPYRTTQRYVRMVLSRYYRYRQQSETTKQQGEELAKS